MLNRIKSAIQNPQKVLIYILRFRIFRIVPDKIFLKIMYRLYIGKKLNIDNPKTYTEKLQWLKINDRKPEYSILADKYEVREYIARTLGKQYLIPLIGVYNSVKDIDWSVLPDRFVLKCTHGSNSNIICTDKDKLEIKQAKKKLSKWMKRNWYWYGREWPYMNVKPRIICEQFISGNDEPPEDYKVMCFNGKAKLIQVHMNRFSKNYVCDNYDINWNKTSISKEKNGLPNSNMTIPRPAFLEEMLVLSEKLAKDIIHVRVDWYIVKNRLYFGEITFYSGCGFSEYDSEDDNSLLGSWINIELN